MQRRESNAIIVYLAEKYDTSHRISAATPEDKIKQLQWLFFQASGQGYVVSTLSVSTSSLTSCPRASPYFGQAVWFKVYHQEKVPSAVERYQKETVRVISVLDGVLQKQEWLVGGKLSVADISFVSYVILAHLAASTLTVGADAFRWNNAAFGMVLTDYPNANIEKDYPAFWK